MTREELREHCENQIRACEMWARLRGDEEPYRKVYEEHKLILELLEQEPFINKSCVSSGVCEHDKNKVLDKIRAEIEKYIIPENSVQYDYESKWQNSGLRMALEIIDKYKAESEE